jgi:hypothetical protein
MLHRGPEEFRGSIVYVSLAHDFKGGGRRGNGLVIEITIRVRLRK